MKRLLWIMLSVSLNCVGLHCKVAKKNTQLCLNTPPDFGKRHFIVGYKEQGAPAQTVIEGAELPAVKEKRSTSVLLIKKRKLFVVVLNSLIKIVRCRHFLLQHMIWQIF